MDFLSCAMELAPELTAWRRALHEHPELGFELPRTTAFVKERLREMGLAPFDVGRAGIGVLIGRGGKTMLLRADMDALPIPEQTGLPYASKNGAMHACGHDMHTAALLGAARLLKEKEDALCGTVKLMFQPCEEGLGGAQDMVDNGILQNPVPDAALALHVVNERTGTAGLREGYACASCDTFTLRVRGTGCHGAAAYLGVDPILTAAEIITALGSLNSREVRPDDMLVLTVCMVNGGFAPNIIPDTCELRGTIRTARESVRQFAKERLTQMAQGIALAHRAECDVEFAEYSVPPMVNDTALARDTARYLDETLGAGSAYEIPAMTGSEDFAVVGQQVPSVLVWFGTGCKDEGYLHGVHHAQVVFNEDALWRMSAVYASVAQKWLEEHR